MSNTKAKIRAYAAHWAGATCADCGGDLTWDSDAETLACACETRSALSVYLGNTPTTEDRA